MITTGMSAPPMEAVMCHPRARPVAVVVASAARPIAGLPVAMNMPPAPKDAAARPMLIWFFPAASTKVLQCVLPASLKGILAYCICIVFENRKKGLNHHYLRDNTLARVEIFG